MGKYSSEYIEIIKFLLNRIVTEEQENLKKAAIIISDVIENSGRVFAWGSTHSSITMQDIYLRAGGLMLVNAIFIPGLEAAQIKPLGLTGKIERLSGYAEIVLDYTPIQKGDVLIVVSVSGRNAIPIEMAKIARERGIKVIAVTGYEYSTSVKSRQSDGKNMYYYADVVLDMKVTPGDAVLSAKEIPSKFCSVSGITGAAILQCLMAETIGELLNRGIKPPIFMSQNLDGGEEHNKQMLERYRDRIFYL